MAFLTAGLIERFSNGRRGPAGKIARLVASNWHNNTLCCSTPLDAASDRPAGHGRMSTNPHARSIFSCAIKPWPIQPIDGVIATNQRGCLAVADERALQ